MPDVIEMPDFPQVVPATPKGFEILEVQKVQKTRESGVFTITAKIKDPTGKTYDAVYGYRPSDPHGLGPVVKEWLQNNPNFPRTEWVEPTTGQQREHMPDLSARQLRLGLLAAGIAPSQVSAAIAAMPAGPDREAAQIEWEYATTFRRLHPLISLVGTALGLTETAMDTMWMSSANI